MPADPLLLKAGLWLGVATGLLLLATVVGFVAGWGTRFRLVGVTSFTGLLAISCLAFAISYSPRTQVAGTSRTLTGTFELNPAMPLWHGVLDSVGLVDQG